MCESFIKQTAKDYDLSIEIVKGLSEKAGDDYNKFYELLEDEIRKRAGA